jgi:DNA replication protein DnaC
MSKPTPIADSLGAEVTRLRAAGLIPATTSPVPATQPLRVTGGLGDPDCPHCHGLGYVRDEVALTGRDAYAPKEFGKVHACQCAQSRIQAAQTVRLRSETGMDESDLQLGWGQLYRTPGTTDAVTAVRQTLARGWGWAYLWGEPGPGKTVLLKTAVAETARAGAGAVFVTWADLLNHMRRGYAEGDYDERLEAWRSVPVLAVDEYGRAKESEWVREAQTLVFNHRYESALAKKTVTLFASNFAPDSEHVDDWFYDRLRDGRFRIVKVAGPSLRPDMRE